jgi:hypothetical protein
MVRGRRIGEARGAAALEGKDMPLRVDAPVDQLV